MAVVQLNIIPALLYFCYFRGFSGCVSKNVGASELVLNLLNLL